MLLFASDKHSQAEGAVMLKVAPKSDRTGLQFPTGTSAVREQAPLRLSVDQLKNDWAMDSHKEAEPRVQQDQRWFTCPPEIYIG